MFFYDQRLLEAVASVLSIAGSKYTYISPVCKGSPKRNKMIAFPFATDDVCCLRRNR